MSGSDPITRTSLTRFAGLMREPDPNRKRRLAKEIYDKHGILIVFPEAVKIGLVDQWWIESMVKRLFGASERK